MWASVQTVIGPRLTVTQAVGDANFVARVDVDRFGVVLSNIKHARAIILFLKNKDMLAFLSHPFSIAMKYRTPGLGHPVPRDVFEARYFSLAALNG